MILADGLTFFDGIPFFICMVTALIPAVILGISGKPLGHYGLAASVVLILLALVTKPVQLAYLAAFYLFELLLVKGYLRLRAVRGREAKLYGLFVFLALLPIAAAKLSEVTPLHLFQFLGISYLTFRVVQMIIEIYDGVIKEVAVVEFSAFLLFFPTISSGPIDRSRRFSEDWNQVRPRDEYLELLGLGIWKLLMGAVYKFVIAALCYQGMSFFEPTDNLLFMACYAYGYGVYLFFDFAGYSKMAVGASYILGVRTPENFDQPFRALDMKDFWNRWHISLSHWFRDFIFSRFMMQAIRKKWFKSKLSGAAAGFLVNMLVMGLWHGLAVNYILYGLYHGALLALTEIYQKKSGFYKAHKKDGWYRACSWLVTLNLVMFGFLLFSGKLI